MRSWATSRRRADPEEVDVEVQVGLQVPGVHAGEAPEVALEPRAQVAHQLHRLQVLRVPRVRLVGLVRKTVLPDGDVMGPLAVADERRALRRRGPRAAAPMRAAEGLPRPQTTATGSLRAFRQVDLSRMGSKI